MDWEANDANLPSWKKQKKTRIEGKAGSEWSTRLQKMPFTQERLIDRKGDKYKELVKDLETGELKSIRLMNLSRSTLAMDRPGHHSFL